MLNKFLVDFLEYNVSLIWNLILCCSIMLAHLEPSTKFLVLDMLIILTFVNVKSRKYHLSQNNCVIA